jgi:hypothetical protein
MVQAKQIASFKLGRRVLIPESEIERILAAGFRPALPQPPVETKDLRVHSHGPNPAEQSPDAAWLGRRRARLRNGLRDGLASFNFNYPSH